MKYKVGDRVLFEVKWVVHDIKGCGSVMTVHKRQYVIQELNLIENIGGYTGFRVSGDEILRKL